MGEIVVLDCLSRLDIPVARVLENAPKDDFTDVVVIGQLANGEEYFASSSTDGKLILWLLKRFEHMIMKNADSIAEDMKTPPNDAPGGVVLDFPKPDAPFWGS